MCTLRDNLSDRQEGLRVLYNLQLFPPQKFNAYSVETSTSMHRKIHSICSVLKKIAMDRSC